MRLAAPKNPMIAPIICVNLLLIPKNKKPKANTNIGTNESNIPAKELLT